MAIASAMPPIPATSGRAKRRRSRSSPRSNSRRASSPTTKKKNVISPLFTQWRRSSATPASPMSIESFVLQSEPYDDASTFTQTSAAAAAASKTAAPPVSVRRNSRSGVCTLRAQAVRPENGGGRLFGSPSALAALPFLGRGRGSLGQACIAERFPEQVDRHRQAGNLIRRSRAPELLPLLDAGLHRCRDGGNVVAATSEQMIGPHRAEPRGIRGLGDKSA